MCLDKGTYDAIGLAKDGNKKRHLYIQNVKKILKEGGHFVIVSCNWTRNELLAHFTAYSFDYVSDIPSPSFTFGGQTGQTTTLIVFKC